MKDLTKGSPSKVMISFAIPVALGNIFQLCYSLADTRVVGSTLGEAALAAVGATTSISTLFIGFLSGLTNGFALLIALCPLISRANAESHALSQAPCKPFRLSRRYCVV